MPWLQWHFILAVVTTRMWNHIPHKIVDAITYPLPNPIRINRINLRLNMSLLCISHHFNHVIMSVMASQITSLTIVNSSVYSRRKSKTTPMVRITGLCEGNSPVTGEFPVQRASNAEHASIWWRHHDMLPPLIPLSRQIGDHFTKSL